MSRLLLPIIVFITSLVLGTGTILFSLKMSSEKPEQYSTVLTCSATQPCPADKPNCENGVCKGGGCSSNADCASWEVCRDGSCRSTAGCAQDSDCEPGKSCVNGICEGSSWNPHCGGTQNQCTCNSSETSCRNGTLYTCGNDCCLHNSGQSCTNSVTCATWGETCDAGFHCEDITNTPVCVADGNHDGQNPNCSSIPDSGCTTGGRGGVDCADCRRTGGVVKNCNNTWYCCYSDGNCYKGNSTEVTCSGTSITNNTIKGLSGNIYRGCETGDKIGTFYLAPGQSRSAAVCTQIDIPGYCGVCHDGICDTPPPPPPPTPPPTPPAPVTCQSLQSSLSEIRYGQSITFTTTKTGGTNLAYARYRVLNSENQEVHGLSNEINSSHKHYGFGASNTASWTLTPTQATLPPGRYQIQTTVCPEGANAQTAPCTPFMTPGCQVNLTVLTPPTTIPTPTSSASPSPTATPLVYHCSLLDSSRTNPERGDSITYTCTATGSNAEYANFRLLKSGQSTPVATKSLVQLNTDKQAVWRHVISEQAEPGRYSVQCQICSEPQRCTQWGKAD